MSFWVSRKNIEGPALQEMGSVCAEKTMEAFPEISGLEDLVVTHKTRAYEWPWAFELVKGHRDRSGPIRVLDVGSDPVFAAWLTTIPGVHVTSHRSWADGHNLGSIKISDGVVISWRTFLERTRGRFRILVDEPDPKARPEYDVVTNISVMEHLPKDDRDRWNQWAWNSLKPGGLYALTLDVLYGPTDGVSSNSVEILGECRDLLHGHFSYPPWEGRPTDPMQCGFKDCSIPDDPLVSYDYSVWCGSWIKEMEPCLQSS